MGVLSFDIYNANKYNIKAKDFTAKQTNTTTENNHQWLDENGWESKTVYVQTKNGDIYESTLNIAKARDGRNIMYAFSNTKRVDGGVVSSTENGRDSHTTINSYDIVAQDDTSVKNQFSISELTSEQKETLAKDQEKRDAELEAEKKSLIFYCNRKNYLTTF